MPPDQQQADSAKSDPIAGSAAFPRASRVNQRGHLEIDGCDLLDVTREFGTPAYIYSESELRGRARAYVSALSSRVSSSDVLFASKSLPCLAAFRLFAEEGIGVDVASGGELHMALKSGFDPGRIVMHGNNKSDAEILYATESGAGLLVIDSFDEIDRCERLLDARQDVLLRVTPGIKPSTHSFIQTGQLDSKFGFGLEDGLAARGVERLLASPKLNLVGVHAHIGSQIFELEPFGLLPAALAELAGDWCEIVDLGGGLGIAYLPEDEPPSIEHYIDLQVKAVNDVFPGSPKILVEPGRSLVGTAGLTAYTVGTVKEIPGVRTYIAVDGGMSDNLRPMLYGSRYDAVIADRAAEPGTDLVTIAGMHCESGDILISDTMLAAPRVGDTVVTPATGAYGHSMANNYNGVPRAPVVFCSEGEARLVVRRETYEDLVSRDV